MNDLLLRVWNLLSEGERPEGVVYFSPDEEKGHPAGWLDTGEWFANRISPAALYDRLCQAAERKLLAEGYEHMHGRDGKYHWGGSHHDGDWYDDAEPHEDQLTAAALALESGSTAP